MLKQQARLIALLVFAADLALVAFAFFAAHALRSRGLEVLGLGRDSPALYPLARYLPLLPVALALWGVLLWRSGRYRSHRRIPFWEEATEVVKVSVTATVLFALAIWVLRFDEQLLGSDRVSRGWLFLFSGLAALLLMAEKLVLRLTARRARSRGMNFRTILVVGTGRTAAALAEVLRERRWWGYRILGFVSVDDPEPGGSAAEQPRPLLGSEADLPHLLASHVVDEVVFAIAPRDLARFEDTVLALQDQGILVRLTLDILPHAQTRVGLEEIDGVPLVTLATAPTGPIPLAVKRTIDLLGSALLLLLTAPLQAGIALAIRSGSPGPALFRQQRCGRSGRVFTMYKFRTMVDGAEERLDEVAHLNEMKGPVFKSRQDPRITPLGRWLRRFSLDELPQLWNVLKGDMSLVGPRPPIPEEVQQYERWQRRRLAMKPGLTCLWQIRGRNEVDFDEWMRMDLEYIDSWSPWLDLKILFKTVPVVLSGRGAS